MYTFVSFTVVELFEKVWQTPMVILKLPSAVDNRQQSAQIGLLVGANSPAEGRSVKP